METTATVRIRLAGDREQNAETMESIRDLMNDLLDMQLGAPVWSIEMVDMTDPGRTRGPSDPRTLGPVDSRTSRV